jgi:hypothetical protein
MLIKIDRRVKAMVVEGVAVATAWSTLVIIISFTSVAVKVHAFPCRLMDYSSSWRYRTIEPGSTLTSQVLGTESTTVEVDSNLWKGVLCKLS